MMSLHQNESPLMRTLGTTQSFKVDMGTLILNVHKLLILSSPVMKLVTLLNKLRKWESSGVSVFILIASNCICTFLPQGYIMSFMLGSILLVGGLGVAHRQTSCLAKVFPPVTYRQEDLYSLDGPMSHAEMIIYYKAMLFKVDTFVQKSNNIFTYMYSVLKWEDLQVSIRWFGSIFFLLTCLHILPLRWTVVMTINIFLLEGKVAQVIIEKAKALQQKPEVESRELELNKEDYTDDWVSYGSQDSVTSAELTQASDSESELSEKVDMSSSDLSDCEDLVMQENQVSKVKHKSKVGMVSKIIEFKKKHQHSHSGSCHKCGVTFSAILKRRHVCSHCGNNFCSRCCARKIQRSFFGATSPAALTETVPVCGHCYIILSKRDQVS